MSYDLAWLHVTAEKDASPDVRRQAGHKLKSALSYIFRHYTLDDLHYPTRGIGLRFVCTLHLPMYMLTLAVVQSPREHSMEQHVLVYSWYFRKIGNI